MIKSYSYTIESSGAGGHTWKTAGRIDCEFADCLIFAIRESFEQLTQGKAVYGRPGMGCAGPYDIHKVLIEQVKQ